MHQKCQTQAVIVFVIDELAARRKLIAKLNRLNRVRVMPGGGVTEANLGELLADTGCTEFHASARVAVASDMRHREGPDDDWKTHFEKKSVLALTSVVFLQT